MTERLIYLLMLVFCCHEAAAAQPIRLMTEEFAPFQHYENGKLTGLSVEIVQAVQKEIGSLDTMAVYPWNRGLRLLAKSTHSALFSMARTPEREDKFKWVGPLSELRIYFFKKTGNPIDIKSMDAERS